MLQNKIFFTKQQKLGGLLLRFLDYDYSYERTLIVFKYFQ